MVPVLHQPVHTTSPTPRDVANAHLRQEIAARLNAEFEECLAWAKKAFGPGWVPSHRHFLVEKDEEDRVRYTSERAEVAATVYTAKNSQGERRSFILLEGEPVPCADYKEGFGPMLLEPHPTRGFEYKGQWCATHRYSLCFAPYELYTPLSAEKLAALREARERRAAEKRERKWALDHPLFAWAEEAREELEGE